MIEFVNCFGVPVGREDEFFAMWLDVNVYMRAKPGYVGHALLRSVATDATYRYVNTAQWESAQHLVEAHDAGFRELAGRLGAAGFTSLPAMYERVHQGQGQHGSSDTETGALV